MSIDGIRKSVSFEKEEHAAYWYDQLALKHYGDDAKINGVTKPNDFIEPIENNRTLPKGVYESKGKYSAYYRGKYIGVFETVKEAENAYNEKKESLKTSNESVIVRNKDGIAIISTSKGEEILVDDDKYTDLFQYFWCVNSNYAKANVGKKLVQMHRYLLNAKEDDIVDHINGNKLDNRLENLRISNSTLNAHNTIKKKKYNI